MSEDKKIVGVTKLYMTAKKIRVTGLYEDGTEFQFAVDRDSKANQKFFDMADEFVIEFYTKLLDA